VDNDTPTPAKKAFPRRALLMVLAMGALYFGGFAS
jgi:hypothetical protein